MSGVPSLPYSSTNLSDSKSWLAQLQTEGYAVIAGVADSEQVQHARGLLWDWLEGLDTGILRDDPDTWMDEA